MQNLLSLISFLLVWGAYAQKPQTYYLSGRPMSISMNNALMISAAEWNIELIYVSDSLLGLLGREEINRRNEIAAVYMANKSDLGKDWLNKLYDLAALEEQRHNLFRSWIQQDDDYAALTTLLFEPIILFTKKKSLFGEYYNAFVVGQLKVDNSRRFSTHATYKVYLKKAKIKSLKTKAELPFILPQNGIQ
jgi:hypothetical protein